LSSGSQEQSAEVFGEITRELRQFAGLSTSIYRAAAAQLGMAVTDMQVLDILDITGPSTAGQLAELTGLTTGAITRILDRLEKARFVRRERDPNDGRKVIVRLAGDKDEMHKVRSLLDSVGKTWDEAVPRYGDEQLAFLLGFLSHNNALSRKKLVLLQQDVLSEGEIFSAPLEDQKNGRLVVSCGISRLTVHDGEDMDKLYQAHFEGPLPGVKEKDGVVTIRYPRRLLGLGEKQGVAEVALGVAIPWQIVIQGGAAEIVAELGGLDLARLEITGGFSMIRLDLSAPSGVVPIRIRGGASEIIIQRPAGVAARARINGWVSNLVFDDQTFSGAGNNVRLQSPDFDPTVPCYDIEITSYANMVAIRAM
jgi:DNA-binding MarR family transcriptional regulator